jgi:hypothetical protein
MVKITNVGVIEKEIAMTFGISEHADKNIVLVQNRKKHMKKHVAEFSDFEKAYESIPEIIRDADYVGLHPNGDSLQYIKKIDGNVLVAVSLGVEEGSVRTMYSITENKLNNYLASGRLRKM